MTERAQARPQPSLEVDTPCVRLGWAMIALFLAGGLLLESFHLMKLELYVDARLRRELWTLAHAHGTLFGVLLVLFGMSGARLGATPERLARASRWLRIGAPLVPLGFLLGGIANSEGDPSMFIVLVPVGALTVLAALVPLLVPKRP